jgi:hypothetical protein
LGSFERAIAGSVLSGWYSKFVESATYAINGYSLFTDQRTINTI